MSEDGTCAGLIGPNAILQLMPVLDRVGGPELRRADAGARRRVRAARRHADDPRRPRGRLHQALRAALPDLAPALAGRGRPGARPTTSWPIASRAGADAAEGAARAAGGAGAGQGDRQPCLDLCGIGPFPRAVALSVRDRRQPDRAGRTCRPPVCHWHAAVFARLYQVLVHPDFDCVETGCTAESGVACVFEMIRAPQQG